MARCGEETRELVAALKRAQRRMWVRCLTTALLTVVALAGIPALATPRSALVPSRHAGRHVPEPRADVDVVQYRLSANESLSSLSRRFWGSELYARELLSYNPALDSVDEVLPAGTPVQVPNYRDFPIEELAAE